VQAAESGEPGRSETRRRKRPRQRDTCGALATPGILRPGHSSPPGLRARCGEWSARTVKGAVKPSDRQPRCWACLREPTREKGPARAGTAPREGKALKGDSSGRERHGTRPRSVGASRKTACSLRSARGGVGACSPASAARTVERGKNPEDGTGEGLVILTPPAVTARSWWGGQGAPGVEVLEGSKNPRRGDPEPKVKARPRKRSRRIRGTGSRDAVRLCRRREPQERVFRAFGSGSDVARGKPRGRPERRGGSAGNHEGATRVTRGPLKGTPTPREPGRARVTVLDRCDSTVSLWRGKTKGTATRRHPQG